LARLRLAPIVSAAVLLAAACSPGPKAPAPSPTPPTAEATATALPSSPPATTPSGPVTPTEVSGFTGIVGRVSIGPTCPVERRDSPCPDRPFLGTVAALRLDGSEAGRAATDPLGVYGIALPPGTYTVVALTSGPLPSQRERPTAIVVAGQTTRVDLQLDSGIR